MCTNRALVDSLECYMDELVDCFEDFVKKSVIAITVAVGLLVAMIAYVLKMIADRSQPLSGRGDISGRSSQNYQNRSVLESNFLVYDGQDNKGTCTISAPCAESHIPEEKVLNDSGLSGCSKASCCLSKSRLSIPSLDTICRKCSTPKLSKKALKDSGKLKSCCSLCCHDKCERLS